MTSVTWLSSAASWFRHICCTSSRHSLMFTAIEWSGLGSRLLPALIALREILSTICLSFACDFCVSVALEYLSRALSRSMGLCEPDRSYARIDSEQLPYLAGAMIEALDYPWTSFMVVPKYTRHEKIYPNSIAVGFSWIASTFNQSRGFIDTTPINH